MPAMLAHMLTQGTPFARNPQYGVMLPCSEDMVYHLYAWLEPFVTKIKMDLAADVGCNDMLALHCPHMRVCVCPHRRARQTLDIHPLPDACPNLATKSETRGDTGYEKQWLVVARTCKRTDSGTRRRSWCQTSPPPPRSTTTTRFGRTTRSSSRRSPRCRGGTRSRRPTAHCPPNRPLRCCSLPLCQAAHVSACSVIMQLQPLSGLRSTHRQAPWPAGMSAMWYSPDCYWNMKFRATTAYPELVDLRKYFWTARCAACALAGPRCANLPLAPFCLRRVVAETMLDFICCSHAL